MLASILITGVGLLALDALFPLGSLSMAQAIRDDRAGHSQTNVDLLLDGADVLLEKAGPRDDPTLRDIATLSLT